MNRHSFVSLITPFDASKSIDWNSFEILVKDQLKTCVSGFFLASTIGEGAFLTSEEKILMAQKISKITNNDRSFYMELSSSELRNPWFLEKMYETSCLGVVVCLATLKISSPQELVELFVNLSNFKKYVILKNTGKLSKNLLDELLALPFVSALYQKNSDIQPFSFKHTKQFIEYDRGAIPSYKFTQGGIVSYLANIEPELFHRLIAESERFICERDLIRINKLSFLQKQLSHQEPIVNIKAILEKKGKCKIFSRIDPQEVCLVRLKSIEKSCEEIKNA
jgi:dihydrodipicolinate synthase/N-acetylneuraminate lyase